MLPRTIIFLRHGESEENRIEKDRKKSTTLMGRIKGVILRSKTEHLDYDLLLSENGKNQAKMTGNYLKKQDIIFDAAFTSPYLRAIQTATSLGLGISWSINNSLFERDWGIRWLNDRSKKFKKKFNQNVYFQGIEDGERLYTVALRARDFLNTIDKENYDNAIVVTHNEFIFVMKSIIEGIPVDEYLDDFKKNNLKNCSMIFYTRANPNNPDEIHLSYKWRKVISTIDDNGNWDNGNWIEVLSKRLYSEAELEEKILKSEMKFSYRDLKI